MNSGSLESFQVSPVRLEPERPPDPGTAVWLSPTSAAIERVDQCVASFGVVSSVLTITSSTFASLIFRGRPGRGSSISRRVDARQTALRHLATESR